MSVRSYLWVLPLITSFMCCAACVIPYIIGTSLGHLPVFLPYISDGGAYPPESCIFSFLLNLSALMILLVVLVKHAIFTEFYSPRRLENWSTNVSLVSIIFGFLMAFGLAGVGNFGELEEQIVHDIFALIAFCFGSVYVLLVTSLSFLHPRSCSLPVAILRVLLFLVGVVSLFFYELSKQLDLFMPEGYTVHDKAPKTKVEFFTPDSPYYVNHLVITGSEWLLAFSSFLFFATFVEEFRKASFGFPHIQLHDTHRIHVEDGQEPGEIKF